MSTEAEFIVTSAGFTDEKGNFFMPDKKRRKLWRLVEGERIRIENRLFPRWFPWIKEVWLPERELTSAERRRLLAEDAGHRGYV